MNQSVIGATQIENIFETKLRENFGAIVGKVAPKKVTDLVRGMEEFFAKAPPDELGQCDICKGWSAIVEGIEHCPYCDDQPVDAKTETKGGYMDRETIVVQAEVVHDRLDEIPINAVDLISSGVELEETKPSKRKKLSGGEIAEKKAITKAPPVPKPTTPLVGIGAGLRPARTEKDLDEALVRYHLAATAGADSLYLMGVELAQMRDHLWQQRVVDEKPKYKSFNQFVTDELDISKSLAYRMVRVVENFTHEQFKKFGAQVLKVLVAAPKEEHEMLLAQAEKGATTRDLEAEVKKIRTEQGIAVMETGTTSEAKKNGRSSTQAASAAAATARSKKESAAITIGLKADHAVIPLLSRTTDTPAKKIDDQPYGVLECINGVSLYVAIRVKPTGEWEAKLTAKRDGDEEE